MAITVMTLPLTGGNLDTSHASPEQDTASTAGGGDAFGSPSVAASVPRDYHNKRASVKRIEDQTVVHAPQNAATSIACDPGGGMEGPFTPGSHEGTQGDRNMRYSAYPNPLHNSSHHDDLDPAALLESLATLDQSQGHAGNAAYGDQDAQIYHSSHPHQNNQYENDHFASLLQAAATAGQNQEDDHHSHYQTHSSRNSQPLQEWDAQGSNANQPPRSLAQKRKHFGPALDAASAQNLDSSTQWSTRSTRRKLTTDIDDAALAREHAIWGSESDHSEREDPSTTYTPLSPSSARVAGVHSAAALFRKPTPASKKYTRPPMSKVFTSLELGPEQFLHLQAAAKSYMLDPAHPERYSCVGNKGKIDTDMVKLKLFGCVEAFLEDEGWGERCWGASAEREVAQGQTKAWRLRWPETRNKIITSVTPLMRRMVTNERQRRYATETRSKEKGGKAPKSNASRRAEANDQKNGQLPPEIDPKLGDYHYTPAAPDLLSSTDVPGVEQPRAITTTNINIVILSSVDTRYVAHKATLVLHTASSYFGIVQDIRSWLPKSDAAKQGSGESLDIQAIKVHLPDGLRAISGEEDWEDAIRIMQETVWMDGSLKVVVEVGTPEENPAFRAL